MKNDLIRTYGDPVLRRRAKEVKRFDRHLKRVVKQMFKTMRAAKGIGLAAPQVGLSQRIIVIEIEDENIRKTIINPEIIAASSDDFETLKEGCLSVPGVEGEVERPNTVIVRGFNVEGDEIEIQAEGLFARALQHETDHLNGVLFVDRIDGMEKDLIEESLAELERNNYHRA